MIDHRDNRHAVVGNVQAILTDHGIRHEADLMQTGLSFVLNNVPCNFVSAHRGVLPDEQNALSVLAGAVAASLDDEQELPDIRARLRELEGLLPVSAGSQPGLR